MYTTLKQNGQVKASGFTPVTFTLNDGQAYTVEASDYGNITFDHWAQTGGDSRDLTLSIGSNAFVTAVYRNIYTTYYTYDNVGMSSP